MQTNVEKMNFFNEIKKDKALYADMLESLRQEDAEILHDSKTALLLQLKSWPLYLLAATDLEEGKSLLHGLSPNEDGEIVLVLRGKDLNTYALSLGYQTSGPCYQTLYEKKEPIQAKSNLVIRHPEREEYGIISKTYTLNISEEEVFASIDRPEFAAGYADGKLAGFIGLHAEGSIGMLHVMDEFRGRGYAWDLSAHMVNGRMAAGAYPYGQVYDDNEASISLQRKMGMTFSKDFIYWMWKPASQE